MNKQHVEQMIKMLNNLDAIMAKAAAHADAKKFDVNNFTTERMIADMLPFTKQIQIACDAAKFCVANLSHTKAPAFEDNEKTWSDLRQRITKTTDYLKTMVEADYSKFKEARVSPSWAGGQWLTGEEYFYQQALPNFYFHITTAYALLRRSGVEIGKADYIGALNFKKP